ncbi:LamG-like jellyroll fold domain-containing protein [Natranaeroarchaeum aerophilus]|uniref:Uncharacterized protein n=1 Tax=Natranaeroarchaeum aerophilus TaxID=2917711 RepID=A0AAE3K524_9EURY|nr:LamG-like jellyroll fold domain-containing protein [Natranaeroarchaeum aerophilus]MCL9813626.1 hypothetical protein [Natranaeroarchaeum aerophilus]
MSEKYNKQSKRRSFLKYAGSGVAATLGSTAIPTGAATTEVDDRGDPIESSDSPSTTVSTTVGETTIPAEVPDGTVISESYDWIQDGAPQTNNTYALQLTDKGGVDPNFRPTTDGDLTIDCYWRFDSGSYLAYLFNDFDSTASGFRAFTNGIAGSGLRFRNVFGGSDLVYSSTLQDGKWYNIRLVLDSEAGTFSAYINGEQIGESNYSGTGWTAGDRFRVMGRHSGSSTTVDYDRFVIVDEAVHPEDGEVVSGLIQYELDDGEGNTVYNGQRDDSELLEPTVETITRPPTGVEPDQPVQASVRLHAPGATVDDIEANIPGQKPWLRRQGGVTENLFADVEITRVEEDTFEVKLHCDALESVRVREPFEGFGYDTGLVIKVGGDEVFRQDNWSTYVFQQVDTVATIVAHPKRNNEGSSRPPKHPGENENAPNKTGEELYQYLRERAEFVCEYYASSLGSHGAHGFDFNFVTRRVNDGYGWLELDLPEGVYFDGSANLPNNSIKFVQDALDLAAEDLNVQFDEYTTAFVLNEARLSRPFYRGGLISDDVESVEFSLGGFNVSVSAATLEEQYADISPYQTPTGTIDAAYDEIDGDKWRHELGHTLGPDEQVGLPDLYDMKGTNLGDVGEWGIMGEGSGPFMSYCKVLGGNYIERDVFNREGWLEQSRNYHLLEDSELDLSPLTEQRLGDDAKYLTSIFGEFTIDVDASARFDIDPIDVDVSVSPEKFHLTTYILEARKGGDSWIPWKDGDSTMVPKSPSENNGVAIYKFSSFSIKRESDLERVLNFENPINIDGTVTVDYIDQGNESEPTLSLANTSREKYEDGETVSTFELERSVESGSPKVSVERNPESLIGETAQYMNRVIAELGDYADDLADDIEAITHADDPLPGISVLAVTSNGKRTGIAPETGNRYGEIEGSSISGTRRRPVISIPGNKDVTISIGASRLKEELQQRGFEPPEEIPYTRTLIRDKDLSFRKKNGIPIIDGRTRQSVKTKTGEEAEQVLLTDVDVDVTPSRINAASQGNFVTATIRFKEEIDGKSLLVQSVAMEQVQAIHDDSYGFVNDPIICQSDETKVQVKFDREKVIEGYGPGKHNVTISGVVDGVTFQGDTKIELFEPGHSNKGRSDTQGNGPPHK